MDNLIWVIYLIDVVCGDMKGIGAFCFIGLVVTLFMFILVKCDPINYRGDKVLSSGMSNFKWGVCSVVFLTPLTLSNFIPSQDTAYKMLAVYGVNEVSKSENVQELMGDGMDILKLTLKDYKDKLESTTKKD
jgi:hypothetical protein